jgi:hypothetical protein
MLDIKKPLRTKNISTPPAPGKDFSYMVDINMIGDHLRNGNATQSV